MKPVDIARRPPQRFRKVLIFLAVSLAIVLALPWLLLDRFTGGWRFQPAQMRAGLSASARALLQQTYTGLDADRLVDYHVHVAGLGVGNTGCEVNPRSQSWLHFKDRFKFAAYLSAAGVTDTAQADQQFVERLLDLHRHLDLRGRYYILAFDKRYRPDGTVDDAHSEFYVPNAYVFALAQRHPHALLPALSVHPYRRDALPELVKWAGQGGRLIKWLPNAQGIDPASPLCLPYYAKMRELGLILLSHTGKEQAVEAELDQDLGNPLRLRVPLNAGVTVIAAHFASLGEDQDLDDPLLARRPSWQLALRLLDDPRYRDLFFVDISAITLANRVGEPLALMLRRTDLHSRLVNGSDYPLPAINILFRLGKLVELGFISAADQQPLAEVYDYNPLLFDLALKRSLKDPQTGTRFAASVFMVHPKLAYALPSAPTSAQHR
ncbi:MAG: amidohydrolase [Myxococcales bacterium]|nr:amidohydrolase [Myxococcales bacterium]